ncbi:unnamed protein product [Microthlaspi erraticum]|uniref:AIG1-type G domain-containing protein n=1 Tax=Microthlaspi erraticum TaxID=1685480 RepID=A0A6D2KBT1_9BRAS|nr:unnamed protein product [Microthlaspi erraticum]
MASDQKNGESFPAKEEREKDDVTPPAKEDHKKDKAIVAYPECGTTVTAGAKLVLIGRTGDGKSATGNSIAREKVFITRTHATEVTQTCQTFKVVTPEGPILNVIDTPGLLDMLVAPDVISKEILRCLTLAEGGLNAVILVISAKTQLSQEEKMTFRTLEVLFGIKIFDYVIIVFSGGDVFEDDDVTYLDDSPDFIKVDTSY